MPLKPEVGQSYITKDNTTVTIIKKNEGCGFPFVADSGEHYDERGFAYHGSYLDLHKSVKLPH